MIDKPPVSSCCGAEMLWTQASKVGWKCTACGKPTTPKAEREELLACPFCGHTAGLVRGPKIPCAHVQCTNCDAKGPPTETPEAAIWHWNNAGRTNRRSSPAPTVAEVEKAAREVAKEWFEQPGTSDSDRLARVICSALLPLLTGKKGEKK